VLLGWRQQWWPLGVVVGGGLLLWLGIRWPVFQSVLGFGVLAVSALWGSGRLTMTWPAHAPGDKILVFAAVIACALALAIWQGSSGPRWLESQFQQFKQWRQRPRGGSQAVARARAAERMTDNEVIDMLIEADTGRPLRELCTEYGIDAPRLRELQLRFASNDVANALRLDALRRRNEALRRALLGTVP
jgi:hypothetical protein